MKKSTDDLGRAAFLLMHGFKVSGRRNRVVFFEIDEDDENNFDKTSFEYLSSPFHQFDACLLAIKKIGNYELK